jgi:hypothetical protein
MQYIALHKDGHATSVANCDDKLEAIEVMAQGGITEDAIAYIASADKWMETCQTIIKFKLEEEKFQHGIPTEVQDQIIN